MNEKVLLTGITGYVGQHCAAELLRQGYEVVGTVRSTQKAEATRAAIAKVAPVEKLSFAQAELLSDAGWSEALTGCQFVLHVASPFFSAEPKDENELIVPAVEGTKRVMAFAQKAGIQRLVLTSSIVAVMAGHETGTYGPETWSDLEQNIGAYNKSKTLAEQAAWKAAESSKMELTVVCPGGIFGPPVGDTIEGESVTIVQGMITGKTPMLPDAAMGMVDVRDVARLHVEALTAPGAAGKRFIAATAQPVEMTTLAAILRGAGFPKVPSMKAPSFLLRFMALFDAQAKGFTPFLGRKASFDNRATFEVLRWKPTPIETSLTEMARAISSP